MTFHLTSAVTALLFLVSASGCAVATSAPDAEESVESASTYRQKKIRCDETVAMSPNEASGIPTLSISTRSSFPRKTQAFLNLGDGVKHVFEPVDESSPRGGALVYRAAGLEVQAVGLSTLANRTGAIARSVDISAIVEGQPVSLHFDDCDVWSGSAELAGLRR